MNIVLWILQGALAFMFLMAGFMKLTKSKDEIREKVGGWVDEVSLSGIKVIGLLELLGAIGIVLPYALGTFPILTGLAAIGLALTMVGAMIVHSKRSEMKSVGFNLILMILAGFVAYRRWIY